MSSVAIRAGNLNDVIIRVSASVTEVTQWSTEYGWALARIVQEAAKIKFLGDQPLFFRPAMPVTVHVLASYEDNHPFESDELMYAELTVTLSSTVSMLKLFNGTELMEGGGVAKCIFDVPIDARSLEISASFLSNSGLTGGATLQGIMSHSPRNRYLQVETSMVNVIPGENIVLHVRSNFYISNFNYMGAYIPMHTSILFDLKDRALVYEFLNINLDESSVIPYRLQRRYIYSTPQGHISVTGDVVGPAFPEIPVNENNLLGYNVMGAETSAFSFASNIWSLHYYA